MERIEQPIADYNAGSLNIDEYLRRLIALSRDLTEEELRAATEDLDEEELAVFDLLTKPDPALTDEEREQVKGVAKRLLYTCRRSSCSTALQGGDARRRPGRDPWDLDELPAEPYPRVVLTPRYKPSSPRPRR